MVRLSPTRESYYHLAWLLATCPELKFRDGKRAITLAKKACGLSHQASDPVFTIKYWEALAAAYAEDGQFDEAVRSQKKALDLSWDGGSHWTAGREQLELYKQKKPYRKTP